MSSSRATVRQLRGEFGDFLYGLRGEESMESVARRANKSMRWYLRIESGGRTFLTPDDIVLLARALGVEANVVLTAARKAGY